MNNLLRHLKFRKIGSESSRCVYGNAVYAFCKYSGKLPDELIALQKVDIEKLIEDFCYHKMENEWNSPRTANTALFMLKTFFKVNGFKGNQKLEVECFHQSVRERTRPEYIPTLDEARRMANVAGSLRNRAIIFFMLSTGLRNSTLRALLYVDVKEELEKDAVNIHIKVHKGMKRIVNSACKGNIEYSVFASEEATEALKLYLSHRRRFGEIHDEEVLFCSEHNRLSRKERVNKPLTARELQVIVKTEAWKAGIKEWKNVVPHCLRKTFESVLRSRLTDGTRLDLKTQEYFMGHILAGSMDTYYDKTKVEELREEYDKLVFTPQNEEKTQALEALQLVAAALDIDFVQLIESRKRELQRNLKGEEKLQLLQEVVKQGVRQFRDASKSGTKILLGDGSSERTSKVQSTIEQTLICGYRQRIDNNLPPAQVNEPSPHMISSKHDNQICINPQKKNNEGRSTQLTLFMMPRESTCRTESPTISIHQLKSKNRVKTDLLSFLESPR